ncbi:MAG: hypothetical protein GY721_09820, partial [Deltaproteobacteria bacterium]|nr:hypothetical protein [Deltaproteobacteria bacterium]
DVYFEGDEIQLKLQKAIASLPEKQQIVFNMKYFDEIKYKDMADILEADTVWLYVPALRHIYIRESLPCLSS